MRLTLTFEPLSGDLSLPVHYNHLVQRMIYKSLDKAIASRFHEEGYAYGKRRLKLFTFSRIFSDERVLDTRKKQIIFGKPARLKIGSVAIELLESLARHLVCQGELKLGDVQCRFISIEVEMPVAASGPLILRTLSPIVTYSTLTNAEGKKKTYYYNPWEREFQAKILDNLRRKWSALNREGSPPSMGDAYIRPLRVTKRNEVIVKFKETVIKGWTGVYEVSLPEPYFSLAYDAGLGSKNSQGFGMMEVVRGVHRKE